MAGYRRYSGGRNYSRSRSSYSGRSSSYSRKSRSSSYSSYRGTGSSYSTKYKNGYKQYNSGSGWKFTHRRVAEKKMGGKIRPGYEVHHINGKKTDNRPSNLTVISRSLHRWIHRNK